MRREPVTSTTFYESLKDLIPGLPDSANVKTLRIILDAGEPARVEFETWVPRVNEPPALVASKYELKERK